MKKGEASGRDLKRKRPNGGPVVRNSYSLPAKEQQLLTDFIKKLRFNKSIDPPLSKSEIVRIGLALARKAKLSEFLKTRQRLDQTHVGRPATRAEKIP